MLVREAGFAMTVNDFKAGGSLTNYQARISSTDAVGMSRSRIPAFNSI